MTNLKKLGEFGLINRFRSRLKSRSPRIKIGIGDDCAVYANGPGTHQIITTDALIENIHFKLSYTSPETLGRKAMSVNVSDIAAMGGTPHLAVVSLAIPKTLPTKFLDRMYEGINQVCKEHSIELAGGDTTASPRHLYINITMVGEVRKNRLFTRSGAGPGDKIFVTGTPGESALGLKLLSSRRKKWLGKQEFQKKMIRTHLDPVPRLHESIKLVNCKAKITSMIDVSDGLAQDLFHICKASKVGAVLREESLPRSPELENLTALNRLNRMDFVLAGGEDYELLFTLKSEDVRKIETLFHNAQTPVTLIGEVSAKPGKTVLIKNDGTTQPLQKFMGFNHFKSKEP
ncbi:MAG: thiamine-monophosphate kinase [Nitrospinaceae bacterium]|nr:MAG: thiamine-monophosphate kinase [Nitrospinaceae bacterium]